MPHCKFYPFFNRWDFYFSASTLLFSITDKVAYSMNCSSCRYPSFTPHLTINLRNWRARELFASAFYSNFLHDVKSPMIFTRDDLKFSLTTYLFRGRGKNVQIFLPIIKKIQCIPFLLAGFKFVNIDGIIYHLLLYFLMYLVIFCSSQKSSNMSLIPS